jgi:hypothetical protein
MVRWYIRQQIAFRIAVMDDECYDNGSCKICGCRTVALQMADKTCEKPCYPPMLEKYEWERFLDGYPMTFSGIRWELYHRVDDVLIIRSLDLKTNEHKRYTVNAFKMDRG